MLLGARIFPLEEGTHEHGMTAGEEENVSMDRNRCEFMFLRCTGVRVCACVCVTGRAHLQALIRA